MARKLLIIMANTDPRAPAELGAPFFQATVAAAMDYEGEVICTAASGILMKKGEADLSWVCCSWPFSGTSSSSCLRSVTRK